MWVTGGRRGERQNTVQVVQVVQLVRVGNGLTMSKTGRGGSMRAAGRAGTKGGIFESGHCVFRALGGMRMGTNTPFLPSQGRGAAEVGGWGNCVNRTGPT